MDDADRIREIIDEEIQPGLSADGLSLEFVSLEDGVVSVKIDGLPDGDVAERYHLQINILQRLKEDLPDLKNVESASLKNVESAS